MAIFCPVSVFKSVNRRFAHYGAQGDAGAEEEGVVTRSRGYGTQINNIFNTR